jgi:dipeptidase
MKKNFRYSSCTTAACGKDANVMGVSFVTHSDDSELSDRSLAYVPSKRHYGNKKRPVYFSAVALGTGDVWNSYNTPRLNVCGRGKDYKYGVSEARNIPLGYIPEIKAKTYGYVDGSYGIMNEAGLSMGECTNGSLFTCGPTDDPDNFTGEVKRLFYSSELSRVAMERCKTCREAIILMGQLIEQYGYWGTGECLPIADGEEAWVFEMCPSKSGHGGYWAAQRVPDDEIFFAGNEFRIRDIQKDRDPYTSIKYNNGLIPVAGTQIFEELGNDNLDWLRSISLGEYNHPFYSLRRVWRAFDLIAPSLKLSPKLEDGFTRDYPFSVKPDQKLKLEDVFSIYRDTLKGTEFETTIDPFGSPDRYNTNGMDLGGDVGTGTIEGAWERPISHYYVGHAYVCIHDDSKDGGLENIIWEVMDSPDASLFVPLMVGPIPRSYTKCDMHNFDMSKAGWVYNRVVQESRSRYCYMIEDINEEQQRCEDRSMRLLNELGERSLPKFINRWFVNDNANLCLNEWHILWIDLMTKYNQGFRLDWDSDTAFALGYPKDWLEKSPWKDGPTKY